MPWKINRRIKNIFFFIFWIRMRPEGKGCESSLCRWHSYKVWLFLTKEPIYSNRWSRKSFDTDIFLKLKVAGDIIFFLKYIFYSPTFPLANMTRAIGQVLKDIIFSSMEKMVPRLTLPMIGFVSLQSINSDSENSSPNPHRYWASVADTSVRF